MKAFHQMLGAGALPHEEARWGANPAATVVLLTELVGQLGDVVGDDLFNLSNVLVGDDLLASLLVDDFLSLVEALLNGALDIEAHGGLLSALTRSKASPEVRGDSPVRAKSECDALVDETCKLGLYVTVEPSVDAIRMPDYAHRNFTAHGLRPSISVHTREGKKNHPQKTWRHF